MSKSSILFLILVKLFLTGCVKNGYVEFYKPTKEVKTGETFQPNPNLEIYGSSRENFDADIHETFKRNYWMIGSASFWASYDRAHDVKEAAMKKGADLVLYSETYRNTSTANTSLSVPDTQTSYHSGNVYTPNTYGSYSGTTTTYGTKEIPISITHHYYDFEAYFFKKKDRKPKIGIGYDNCNEKKRRELGKNQCVFVTIVYYDTSAFRQNLMEGDIITKLNGHEITDFNSIERIFDKIFDRTDIFEFEVVRNNKKIEVNVDTRK